jgi:multidrug resistance efflux pump
MTVAAAAEWLLVQSGFGLLLGTDPGRANFETVAADLRKRALEVKRQDEGLRKRDLEVKERDELKGFVRDANAELRCEPQRPQQQRQVLKGSQRALKQSVSHIITVGLKDIQRDDVSSS